MDPTCIQCRDSAVKWQEKENPKKTFCSRLCQIGYHLIGLHRLGDNVVGLESILDGTQIRLTIDEARQMKTIENLLEDAGGYDYIPIQIDGVTLLGMQEYLQNKRLDTRHLSDDAFFNLLKGADYLEFLEFIYYLLPEWVNRRPFPGPPELNVLIEDALYFLEDLDRLDGLAILDELKEPILDFVNNFGRLQWAIRLASENGHLDVVNRLLQIDGVDPTALDNWAIRGAVHNGHLDVVERLLQIEEVDPTVLDNSAIIIAAQYGHLDVVNRLLKVEGVDPTARNNQAIRLAAANGHFDVVNRLLQIEEVDPTARDNYAIRGAAANGHFDVVNRLLQIEEVDPTAVDNEAIRWAALSGYLDIVNRLLQTDGVDATALENWAIRGAARNGHLNVVNRLLQIGRVDPTALDNEAIRGAARRGHFDVVERLLQDGRVDPEALRDIDGPAVQALYREYSKKRTRLRSRFN